MAEHLDDFLSTPPLLSMEVSRKLIVGLLSDLVDWMSSCIGNSGIDSFKTPPP